MNKPWPGLGGALALLAAALGGQYLASGLLRGWTGDALVWGFAAVNLVVLGTTALVGYRVAGRGPRWVPARPLGPRFWAGLGAAAAGGTVVLGELSNLTVRIFPVPAALAAVFDRLTGGPLGPALAAVALVAPLTEELLFRGLLLRSFADRWGPGPGLVLSSLLFGLFHLNLWQAPVAAVAGLYLGWLYLATGSLAAPMAAHALFNGLPVTLAALGWQVAGYNTPLGAGADPAQPPLWLALGAGILVTGLVLTRPWARLSPTPDSDTMAP